MISLAAIDRVVQQVSFVNLLVDKIVSKIVPSTAVMATCPDGWYTTTTAYYEIFCLDRYDCPIQCAQRVKIYYYYHNYPYACEFWWAYCLHYNCPC